MKPKPKKSPPPLQLVLSDSESAMLEQLGTAEVAKKIGPDQPPDMKDCPYGKTGDAVSVRHSGASGTSPANCRILSARAEWDSGEASFVWKLKIQKILG